MNQKIKGVIVLAIRELKVIADVAIFELLRQK